MDARPAVIVLAAGKGSRFKGTEHKLAQNLGGQTVLGTTLSRAIESELPVVVVTTEALAEVARGSIAARDVIVVPEVGSTQATPLGMGFSIAAGVSARPNASGWLILPGDMPPVRPATLQRVARELETHAIVYAQYKGRRGHPVGFSGELYSELVVLIGDEGARRLIARYPAFALNVDDPGVLVDVDTVADLESVRRTGFSDSGPETRW
jgi:molybdenum cofactor cytidylyltransferase